MPPTPLHLRWEAVPKLDSVELSFASPWDLRLAWNQAIYRRMGYITEWMNTANLGHWELIQ